MKILDVFRGDKPDITPAQVGAALIGGVPVVANLLHAFGVYTISQQEQDALTDTIKYGAGFAAVIVLGDAHLRAQRGKASATVQAAALMPVPPPVQAAAVPPPVQAAAVPPPEAAVDPADAGDVVEELPTDEEEFAAPPGTAPVQPSQTGAVEL